MTFPVSQLIQALNFTHSSVSSAIFSLVADQLVFPKNTVLDASIGEHPHALAMIVIVLEHSDVVLAAGEENTTIAIKLIVPVLTLMNLIVVKDLAPDPFEQLALFLELSDIDLVGELHFLELLIAVLKTEFLVMRVIDDVLDRQGFELHPVFDRLLRERWVCSRHRTQHVSDPDRIRMGQGIYSFEPLVKLPIFNLDLNLLFHIEGHVVW